MGQNIACKTLSAKYVKHFLPRQWLKQVWKIYGYPYLTSLSHSGNKIKTPPPFNHKSDVSACPLNSRLSHTYAHKEPVMRSEAPVELSVRSRPSTPYIHYGTKQLFIQIFWCEEILLKKTKGQHELQLFF